MLLSFASLFSEHTLSQVGEDAKSSSLLIIILPAWFLRTNYYVASKIAMICSYMVCSCEYKDLESLTIVFKLKAVVK